MIKQSIIFTLYLKFIKNTKYWCAIIQFLFRALKVSVNLTNLHSFKNTITDYFWFSSLFYIYLKILNIFGFNLFFTIIKYKLIIFISIVSLTLSWCLPTFLLIVLFTTSSKWWSTFVFSNILYLPLVIFIWFIYFLWLSLKLLCLCLEYK